MTIHLPKPLHHGRDDAEDPEPGLPPIDPDDGTSTLPLPPLTDDDDAGTVPP